MNNSNMSAIAIDMSTLDVQIRSDETSGNIDIASASSAATEDYLYFPGSWYQYRIEDGQLFISDSYPLTRLVDPCTVTDGSRYSYLTGGYDNTTYETSNSFQIYDEYLDEWIVSNNNMINDRVYHSCVISNDILYVFGGCTCNSTNYNGTYPLSNACIRNEENYLLTIEYYNLNCLDHTNTNSNLCYWNVLNNNVQLSIGRILSRTIVPNLSLNEIWFIGGYNPSIGTLSSIEIYNINNNTISNGPNLILSRASSHVAKRIEKSGQTCIYILGGYYSPIAHSILIDGDGDGDDEYGQFFSNGTVLNNFEYICFADFTNPPQTFQSTKFFTTGVSNN